MMQLCGALALLCMTLSTVWGLRCYTCKDPEHRPCNNTMSCPVNHDHCYSLRVEGASLVTKGCGIGMACGGSMKCCKGDLCNSAVHVGPSSILLLVSCWLLITHVL